MFKKLIFALLLGLSPLLSTAKAQAEEEIKVEHELTEFEVSADSVEELKSFDWQSIEDLFKDYEAEQEIKLRFVVKSSHQEQNENPEMKPQQSLELRGKAKDLDAMKEKFGKVLKNWEESSSE